ncbi:MAG: alpha-L-fucosidase precursor [Lentisphaerae bacterium]|nr:MAG: alpha-L-fucosidase precursor [Lentisphaerota bacterium]
MDKKSFYTKVPGYLGSYSALWEHDPHQANLSWFHRANWGLFIHYGLYSQLGRGEWVMFHERIPIQEYEKLFDTFNPEKFDADFITDLALEAEMRYITFTSCHHEGFCLWNSQVETFNSYRACGRDLVRELAEQCARKGLGFFTYYTHILNWRHPLAMTGPGLEMCRPAYEHDEPRYQIKDPSENGRYWEYAHQVMEELLELEYPLSGMWLDIIMAYYQAPEHIPIEKTYELIRQKRPECLISFKQGATGTEDFAAPEHSHQSLAFRLEKRGMPEMARLAERAWQCNAAKHNEYCTTLQEKAWGYHAQAAHYGPDEVWGFLAFALANHANLLLNVGPLPDGSIHPQDVATLREVGKRIRKHGWPEPDAMILPGRRRKAAQGEPGAE